MKEPKGVTYEQEDDGNPLVFWSTLLIALAAHLALYFAVGDRGIAMLSGFTMPSANERKILRDESSTKIEVLAEDPEHPFQAELPAPRQPYDIDPERQLQDLPTDTPASAFEPPYSASDHQSAPNAAIQAPPAADLEKLPPAPLVPREQIAIVEKTIIFDDIVPLERLDIAPIERIAHAPDIAPEYRLAASTIEEASRVGRPAYIPPAPPAAAEIKSDNALAPAESAMPDEIKAGPEAEAESAVEHFAEIPAEVAPAIPIENVLAPAVAVYRPRRPDGYQYFQIDIRRKAPDILPPLPRDILLVQDASGSLGYERLGFCKRAFNKIVASLRPEDRFNILSFNTQNVYAFGADAWRAPDAPAQAQARDFIAAMKSEGNTDIFNAVKGVLSLPRDPSRVMLVILVSDGVTTSGQIQRDSEIIAQFSQLNSGSVSVFSLGTSRRSNEYLLSMLSFQNRGGAAVIAPDRFDIEKAIDAISASITSPVLSDISFMFLSDTSADVAPRMSTNLYLDRSMSLFGRVPDTAESVVFQARGRAAEKKYDMVFDLDLATAAPGKEDIQSNWARTKMYDLVSEYAIKPSTWLLREMNELGRKYDITIPFRDRIL